MPSLRVSPSSNDATGWIYELQPAYPLPVVDLSVSVRSRFLSARWIARTDRWLTYRQPILLSFIVSATSSFVMLLVPRRIGQVLSVIAAPLGLVAPLAGVLLLRYNVVRLLTRTYDFWFLFVVASPTLLVLGIQLRDARAALILSVWICMLPNMMIDASIRAVRRFAFLNTVAAVSLSVILTMNTFGESFGMRRFAIISYRQHELPSDTFVSSGPATVLAILLRNIYRKRETFRKRANPLQIECVSYRSQLRLLLGETPHQLEPVPVQSPSKPTDINMQEMQCVRILNRLDARNVVGQFLLTRIQGDSRWLRRFLRHGTLATVALSIISVPIAIHRDAEDYETDQYPVLHLAALQGTLLLWVASLLLYQRQLILALLTSFDFAFLSVQFTVVHLGLCDFFQWGSPTLIIAASWVWIHWILCLDALTPLVRTMLGISAQFPAVVFTLLVASSFVAIYVLIFADTRASKHDRVLWRAVVWGEAVELRLVPVFFNCLATLLALSARILYRLWTSEPGVLIMLDGPVVYNNYLRMAPDRMTSRTR